jgi:uncharacterized membrane protein
MTSLLNRLPLVTCLLLAVFVGLAARDTASETTMQLIAASIGMFALSWYSAIRVLGARAALHFVVIAVTLGWGAEQLGSSYGWFFGAYDYTRVLGPRFGHVPVIIALMWFALTYAGYIIANLILVHKPVDGNSPLGSAAVLSLLAAMVVTAFDLGADPYMVYVLKAWIMRKTDGWWFGETLEGFFGWMLVSFVIVFAYRTSLRWIRADAPPAVPGWPVLVPLAIYAGAMVFQMALGYPVETRTIAFFAMGLPLLCALWGWSRWRAAQTAGASA